MIRSVPSSRNWVWGQYVSKFEEYGINGRRPVQGGAGVWSRGTSRSNGRSTSTQDIHSLSMQVGGGEQIIQALSCGGSRLLSKHAQHICRSMSRVLNMLKLRASMASYCSMLLTSLDSFGHIHCITINSKFKSYVTLQFITL